MSGRLDFVYSYSYCQCMQYSCYSPRLDGHINRLFFPIGWQAIIIHERCHCICTCSQLLLRLALDFYF